MLTGPNGLLTQASDAKTKTSEAGAKEKVQIAVAGSWGENGFDLEDFKKEIKERFKGDITSGDGEFPIKVTMDGYDFEVSEEGVVTENGKELSKEITFKNVNPEETNPAGSMPKGATVVEENGEELNDVDKGIVIKDTNNNEWVWIEVPKSIYKNPDYTKEGEPSGETDYDKITKVLKAYAAPYTKGSATKTESCTDEWYDQLGTTYDGENEYSEIKYVTTNTWVGAKSVFTIAKEYYGTIYKDNTGTIKVEDTESRESGTKYYAKITEKLNDASGCGLTYSEYQNTYQTMLKSVYKNGGFWIGRYEAGIEGTTGTDLSKVRATHTDITDSSPKVISQKDAIPYNFIYCSEAQKLASKMTPDSNKTSSLLFGIQWDLVCKFIEEKEVKEKGDDQKESIKAGINLDSGEWGNYLNKSFTCNNTNGKCLILSSSNGYGATATWQKVPEGYTKQERLSMPPEGATIFSTGVVERNRKFNIYDLAGNEYEWTLEHGTTDITAPCSYGGGSCVSDSSNYPASSRGYGMWNLDSSQYSFRPALY